jgi:preprotein translocase subunit SecB
MSDSSARNQGQLPIAISAPELWHLTFERLAEAVESDESALSLNTELGVARLAQDEIGVQLTVSIKEGAPFTISVTYRARFQVEPTEELGSLDEVLKIIAARIAPGALYPFAREAISSCLARAGIRAPLLPVLNFGSMFDPGDIELPGATS